VIKATADSTDLVIGLTGYSKISARQTHSDYCIASVNGGEKPDPSVISHGKKNR
jgi:hypothetical protein